MYLLQQYKNLVLMGLKSNMWADFEAHDKPTATNDTQSTPISWDELIKQLKADLEDRDIDADSDFSKQLAEYERNGIELTTKTKTELAQIVIEQIAQWVEIKSVDEFKRILKVLWWNPNYYYLSKGIKPHLSSDTSTTLKKPFSLKLIISSSSGTIMYINKENQKVSEDITVENINDIIWKVTLAFNNRVREQSELDKTSADNDDYSYGEDEPQDHYAYDDKWSMETSTSEQRLQRQRSQSPADVLAPAIPTAGSAGINNANNMSTAELDDVDALAANADTTVSDAPAFYLPSASTNNQPSPNPADVLAPAIPTADTPVTGVVKPWSGLVPGVNYDEWEKNAALDPKYSDTSKPKTKKVTPSADVDQTTADEEEADSVDNGTIETTSSKVYTLQDIDGYSSRSKEAWKRIKKSVEWLTLTVSWVKDELKKYTGKKLWQLDQTQRDRMIVSYQVILNSLWYGIAIDWIQWPQTRNTLGLFAKHNSLDLWNPGAGPKTTDALIQTTGAPEDVEKPWNDVLSLQQKMKVKWYYKGPLDWIVTPETREALNKFNTALPSIAKGSMSQIGTTEATKDPVANKAKVVRAAEVVVPNVKTWVEESKGIGHITWKPEETVQKLKTMTGIELMEIWQNEPEKKVLINSLSALSDDNSDSKEQMSVDSLLSIWRIVNELKPMIWLIPESQQADANKNIVSIETILNSKDKRETPAQRLKDVVSILNKLMS